MGLALLRARHLSASATQMVVWDGQPSAGPAGTAADMAIWDNARLPRKVVTVGNGHQPMTGAIEPRGRIERRPRAMLFGDVHGFSGLRDDQLPRFIELVLGGFAAAIDRRGSDILLANTWGDGLFLVFDDAGKAADCALDLQESVGRLDLVAEGLPADMRLRIGLHLGPAYTARDPVQGKENFFGVHVSRAARIEPVTPEGSVYVTETMAAVLALYNARDFVCEYVGNTEAAKHYGTLRMFLLRRGSAAPAG
jgi:class 3 adenylate cyclase